MPIAKETLRDGFVVVAVEGTYVSQDVVDKHGWQDKVEDGPEPVSNEGSDDAAPKGRPQKGR